ncbi:DUF4177 domain-containing protein [Alkalihalobacterium sp. APHAB7]|uniref:DUF4177 domain-containing protein n=1 Tax=Alkalihalobacterium sp. APHAB7 TaxID=3402081 RepID=UPI003AAB592F
MYEYKFVKVDLKSTWKGTKPEEDYHTVIKQHGAEGWRLVQIFAPAIAGYGAAEFYEIIFEKKID